jgi:hypothetical protein
MQANCLKSCIFAAETKYNHIRDEMDNKTQKYYIPEHGIYVYARNNEGKRELIVLNNTDEEQVVDRKHFHRLLEEHHLAGKVLHNGSHIDVSKSMTVGAHQSLVIQF